MKQVIFTDLDGTLLDFNNYSYSTISTILPKLEEREISVVFCSSKTKAEQEYYRSALDNQHPFITENGSAIFIPVNYFPNEVISQIKSKYQIEKKKDYWIIQLGESYLSVRKEIEKARNQVGIKLWGYGDLSMDEIQGLTHLNAEFAQRAANRDYSETLLKGDKEGKPFQDFVTLLKQRGLTCVSGGKFHTVMGVDSDKGRAVEVLSGLYKQTFGEMVTIGIGDSANDIPLLKAVDKAYLVQKPGGYWSEINDETISKVEKVGPEGWMEITQSLISV